MAKGSTKYPGYQPSDTTDYSKLLKNEIRNYNNRLKTLREQGFDVDDSEFAKYSKIGKTKSAYEYFKGRNTENLRATHRFIDKETGNILKYDINTKMLIDPNDDAEYSFKSMVRQNKEYDKNLNNYTEGYFDGSEYVYGSSNGSYIPQSNLYDDIRNKIINGPQFIEFRRGPGRENWVRTDTEDLKNHLISLLDDLYSELDEDFDDYIESNWGTIEDALDDVYDDSQGEEVKRGYGKLIDVLTGPGVSDMNEMQFAGMMGEALGVW